MWTPQWLVTSMMSWGGLLQECHWLGRFFYAVDADDFDADDFDADADNDVNADNADTDNPDLSVTLMMAELHPLHSQTVSLLLLLLLKLVLPVM